MQYGILRAMINMSEDMPLREIRKRLNLPRARKRKLPTIEELQTAADLKENIINHLLIL